MDGFPPCHRPDHAVPVRRHAIELNQLLLQDVIVRLAVRECERRPGTPDVVAVRGPIAIEPVQVLVEHGSANRFDRFGVCGGRASRHLADDDLGDLPVADLVEMDSVEGEWLVGGLE